MNWNSFNQWFWPLVWFIVWGVFALSEDPEWYKIFHFIGIVSSLLIGWWAIGKIPQINEDDRVIDDINKGIKEGLKNIDNQKKRGE